MAALLAFAAYAAAAKLGLAVAIVNPSASAVWAPSGLALALFLRKGPGLWPAILLAAFVVNWHTTGVAWTSALVAVGNTAEGLVGAWLALRWARGHDVFGHPKGVAAFALAVMTCTLISAAVGVTTLSVGGLSAWADYGRVWLTWWLGDAAGALLVAPLLGLWWAKRTIERAAAVELAVVGAGAVGLTYVALGAHSLPLLFLLLPPVIWTAQRRGAREGVTVAALVTVVAVSSAIIGQGAPGPRPNEELLVLQGFAAVLAVVALSLGASTDLQRRQEDAQKTFFATLSHDLRTPIAAIKGFAETLLLGGLDDEGNRSEFVRIIERHADRLAALADSLLRVAVLETRREAPTGAVLVRFVLEEAVRGLQPMWKARQLDVRVEPGTELLVSADEGELLQIIQNLLDNAIKFNSPGGSVRLGAESSTGLARIWVEDTGIGLTEQELGELFAPLARSSRVRSIRGVGLGLYVARRLAEAHGGRLWGARSEKGARFTVELPLAD